MGRTKQISIILFVVMMLAIPVGALANSHTVTFDLNFYGAEPIVVEVPDGELVTPPEKVERPGYTLDFWGQPWFWFVRQFDLNTPITEDTTLVASWSRITHDDVPSLYQEYDDYFIMGTFGGRADGQGNYHYRTFSGNDWKLTYNIGGGDKDSGVGTPSRTAYDQAVASINADTSLDDAERERLIEEANRNVELVDLPPGITTLENLRIWNEANPDKSPKLVRAHVLAWHGPEQPDYFFCNGFHFDPENPDWVSPETMLARLDNYIQKMMELYSPYKNIIISWDVVNEAIDCYTGQIRNSEGYQVGEWGTVFRRSDLDDDPDARLYAESAWVRQAFASARKWSEYYDCDWTLYYNDFQDSNKLYEPKMSQTIKMLEPIYEAGNIDGYGMQGRLAWAYPSIDLLREHMELGLTVADEISFSEADIRSDFEPNPYYDPSQPTRRVREGDPEWPENSGSFTLISSGNGNTFDVHNSPVRRIPEWGAVGRGEVPDLALSEDIQMKQADFAADLMDLMLEYQDYVIAYAWDGSNDQSTFNSTTACHMWDKYGDEKYSFYAIIGAPNRYKLQEAISSGPAVEDADKYTVYSWNIYQDALEQANDLVDLRIYDLEGVNAVKYATQAIYNAIDQLVAK